MVCKSHLVCTPLVNIATLKLCLTGLASPVVAIRALSTERAVLTLALQIAVLDSDNRSMDMR